MFSLKGEKIKKSIFLTLAAISAFMVIADLLCTLMGENSPVKFIIHDN